MQEYQYNTFYDFLVENTKRYPNKKIIYTENGNLKNKELLEKVDKLANFLSTTGIKTGDKVAMVMYNSDLFAISLFAITKIGAIAVPINNFLKNEELTYILNNCEAKLLITSNEFKKELGDVLDSTNIENVIWVEEEEQKENNFHLGTILSANYEKNVEKFDSNLDDTAIIIYTSGTTGHPRGAMLTYKNIISNATVAYKKMKVSNKDRFIVFLPMFHSFTLTVMVCAPIIYNCSIVIVKSIFPFANVLKQVLLKRVTIFLGAPQIYNALNKAKIPWYFMWFNSIRIFVSGAAPLSEQVFLDFKKKFKKATMIEGYGLSECSPAVSANPLNKQKILSVGTPFEGYEVKIVDDELIEVSQGEVGELVVKGDCVMKGYFNNEEATDNTIVNGWLKTGDLAKLDNEGYIYIVDRKKDLIISKGMNIYPREIEEEIMKIDSIDATAVVGIEDVTKDEKIVAFVQLKEDVNEPPSPATIKTHLKEHLANFKIPKDIYFIDELPKNAANKVLKRKLKEDIKLYTKK